MGPKHEGPRVPKMVLPRNTQPKGAQMSDFTYPEPEDYPEEADDIAFELAAAAEQSAERWLEDVAVTS